MAQKKSVNEAGGKTVELADKDTSFFDPETQVKVVRDAQVPLGKTVGRKTNVALASGRLLVVGSETKAELKTKDASDLPEDIPGREALVAAKMSFDQVKKHDFEKNKVAGVGEATITALGEYLK